MHYKVIRDPRILGETSSFSSYKVPVEMRLICDCVRQNQALLLITVVAVILVVAAILHGVNRNSRGEGSALWCSWKDLNSTLSECYFIQEY